jgi:hypothetical protein
LKIWWFRVWKQRVDRTCARGVEKSDSDTGTGPMPPLTTNTLTISVTSTHSLRGRFAGPHFASTRVLMLPALTVIVPPSSTHTCLSSLWV